MKTPPPCPAPLRNVALATMTLLFIALPFASRSLRAGETLFPDNDKQEIPAPLAGPAREISIFNGKDFSGFAGDPAWWTIENGEIVAKAPNGIKHNTFLQSKQRLGDFRLVLQIKLVNDAGNSGIQFRSEALKGFEAKGYQADAGPGWWGKIYEEHGRGLIASTGAPDGVVKKGDWNLYEILCVGTHIRTAINGVLCSELNDPAGAKEGVICFQLHSGPATEIRVKDLRVEVNPEDKLKTVTAQRSKPGELSPEEERATFKLPDGFSAELVCSEPHAPKVVDIAFDDAGRMWALTAMEYPLDGNEQPKAAAELFAKGGKDKILVFDQPHKPGPHVPRVFAENLAMPMAVLPYKNGAIVGHGSEILFLEDTDGDGKADKRTVLLSGFGIQDSHLFPHRFIRGPGDWVYFAQGAFNYSDVKTKEGKTVQFHQCKLGRFKLDGSRFEIAGVGMNNIWGMVIGSTGEMFIQEANDCGYPVVPFYVGATYAGGGMHKFRPYSPWQTPLAEGFQMGGTGLSGLAMSEDANGFPPPYDKTMFLANPITNKIQQVKISSDGAGYKLEKLPEFLETSDKSFRPVAMYFAPDGCLYIVDWYNKVISHNEVPRNHPERDKLRSRVWRIRHNSMKPFDVPDLTKAADAELLQTLRGGNVRLVQAAQRQIADRNMKSLAPELKKLAGDAGAATSARLAAVWSLESLIELDAALLQTLIADKDRNIRREAIRAAAESKLPASEILKLVDALANEADPQVRAETLRTLGAVQDVDAVVARLVKWARGPLFGRTVRTPQGGALCNTGEAADRDFERFMWRLAAEPRLARIGELAKAAEAAQWPAETKALVGLALGNKDGIALFTQTMPALQRELSSDEISFLMQNTGDPAAAAAVGSALKNPDTAQGMLRQLLQVKEKVNAAALSSDIATAAKTMFSKSAGTPEKTLVLQLATAFKIKELEADVLKILEEAKSKDQSLAALRALSALGSSNVELLQKTVRAAKPGDEVYNESVAALAASTNEAAIPTILELWPMLPPNTRRLAVDRLTAKADTARSLVKGIKSGEIKREEVDGYMLGKLQAILADDADLADLNKKLAARMKKSLRLSGSNGYAGEAIALSGAFTVETWVKLEPNIGNQDAILGAPGKASFNFYDGRFRVWWGTDGDTVIARKPTEADQWQHIAVTRNKDGVFKLYLNGELDATGTRPFPRDMDGLFIGRSTVDPGTQGRLAEFRVWNVERTSDEIREWSTLAADAKAKPTGLVLVQGSATAWTPLQNKAAVELSLDFPPILSTEEAAELRTKFETNRQLAAKGGDLARGKTVFTKTCAVCHKARGEGSDIGPPLDGTGAHGTESLLRNILQPSAAVESGFRQYRVETTDRQILEGLLFSQNDTEVVLRRAGQENARIERAKIKRAGFSQMSIMPEGLLDGLTPQEVSDLFAYLLSLK